MKIINITQLIPLSKDFSMEIQKAKDNVDDLEVNIFSAPRNLGYTVPSPIVEYKTDNTYRREYGTNGLSLLKNVTSGKIE